MTRGFVSILVSAFGGPLSGTAAYVHEGAVAPVRVRIDEAHGHEIVRGGEDLAVLRVARGRLEAEIGPARRITLEPEFVELRVVGDMHHHPIGWTIPDRVGEAALGLGFAFGPLPILVGVERRDAPPSDQALPRVGGGSLAGCGRRRLARREGAGSQAQRQKAYDARVRKGDLMRQGGSGLPDRERLSPSSTFPRRRFGRWRFT